jgi:hypothetical protein
LGNQEQNRQFRAAVREVERRLGRKLNRNEIDRLHREVSKQHHTFDVIVEIGVGMFG